MIYTKQFKTVFLVIGKGRRFGLGLVIDKYGANLDFGPFWFAIEF